MLVVNLIPSCSCENVCFVSDTKKLLKTPEISPCGKVRPLPFIFAVDIRKSIQEKTRDQQLSIYFQVLTSESDDI